MATFVGFAPATHPVLAGHRRPQPADPDLRRHGVGPGLLPDHELRPAPLRHPHHPGCAHPGRPRRGQSASTRHRTSREDPGGLGDRRGYHRPVGRARARTVRADRGPGLPTRIRADEPVARRDRRGRDDGRPLGRRRARDRRTTADGWRPGDLFCCLPGATDRRPRARGRGGGPGGRRPRLRAPVDRPGSQRCPRPWSRPDGSVRPWPGWPPPSTDTRSRHLVMAGVTGTNGKTTVTHLLGAVLAHRGPRRPRSSGTLTGVRTTPEATELQRLLAEVRDAAAAPTANEPGGGHGGLQPRAGPGAGRRRPLRRGRVHQPEPRPPRLPPDDGRTTSRPRPRCSRPSGPCAGW